MIIVPAPPISRQISPPYRRIVTRALLTAALIAAPTAAYAQGIVQPLPASPSPSPAPQLDPAALERQTAQQALTVALARIAANGDDWPSLTQAGRAALILGDPRAALGFLSRAEILAPRDPIIKAAIGAALVRMEDAAQAMRFFDSAVALGGLERAYLADRGLAFDLLGDQRRAQGDYAAAAQFAPSAEVTRRYAISLGIAGQQDAAIQMLGPLLRAQDRAAWRSRAMIVAMSGRPDEARQIARATMPAQLAQGLDPYFALMPRLTSVQLAAAAHFGRFPTYETVAAQPVRNAGVQVAAAPSAPAATTAGRRATRPGRRVIAAGGTTAPLQAPRPSAAARRDAERTAANQAQRPSVAATAQPRIVAPAPLPAPSAIVQRPPALTPAPLPASLPPAPYPTPLPAPAVVATAAPQAVPTPQSVPTSVPSAMALPPAQVGVPTVPSVPPSAPAVQTVDLPPSQPATVVPMPSAVTNVAVAGPPAPDGRLPNPPVARADTPTLPAVVQPVVAPANTNVLTGWSLDDVVQSVTVPDSERSVEAGALGIEELRAIATERRRAAAAAAAERRDRERADARERAEAEAAAAARAAEVAQAREEAEARNRHPARTWVQIATGSDAAALAYDYRRMSRANAALYDGQTGATAVWNRTRRLVVGPFRTAAQARAWLARLSTAGGDGFVWTSDAGQEVTPIARR